MDKFFKISERGSTVKTETIAGLTTFFVCFVLPALLALLGLIVIAVLEKVKGSVLITM